MNPITARSANVTARINSFKTSVSSVKRGPSTGKAFRPRGSASRTIVAKPAEVSSTVQPPKSSMLLQPRPAAKNHYAGSPLLNWFHWSAQAAQARQVEVRKAPSGARPQPALIRPGVHPQASRPVSPGRVTVQQPDLDLNELDALLAGYESVDEYKNANR